MKIKLVWSWEELNNLRNITEICLSEIWLDSIVKIEETNDEAYKIELWITQNPAFCVEEESIDFRDMIFEWLIPEKEEIRSMLISIIGWEFDPSCSTDSCMTCSGC